MFHLRSCLGRWLKRAQVRRPVLGVFNRFAFRGGRRSHRACLLIIASFLKPCLAAHIHCDPYSASLRGVPGFVHPRRCYRHQWSQSYWRQRGACQQRKSGCFGRLHCGRQLSDSDRRRWPVFSGGLGKEFSPIADAGFLRRPSRQHRAHRGAGARVGTRVYRSDCDWNSHTSTADQRVDQRPWPDRPRLA